MSILLLNPQRKKRYKDIVTNGNFANGIIGWNPTNCTISASNKTLIVTGNGTLATVTVTATSTDFRLGQKIYCRYNAMVTNSICTQIEITIGGFLTNMVTNPIQNQWYTISTISTVVSDDATLYVAPKAVYSSASASNGEVMQVQQLMAVDLTATFCGGIAGTGNEPSQIWCDANLLYV